MKQWLRRAGALHAELAELADVRAPWWWMLAGAATAPWGNADAYIHSDAEPASDTFIGHVRPPPSDPIVDAVARAHAAREAIRELDGLPEQQLAATIERGPAGATVLPSTLEVAAFAIGDRVHLAQLAESVDGEAELLAVLAGIAHREHAAIRPADDTRQNAHRAPLDGGIAQHDGRSVGPASPAGHIVPGDRAAVDMRAGDTLLADRAGRAAVPFVCITLGEEPGETARHGHRRAWTDTGGPWLGCSRADGMSIVSTCHLAVDGYGHAVLAARIDERTRELVPHVPRAAVASPDDMPAPIAVRGAVPLAYAWRETPSGLRVLPLAYALGVLLHRAAAAPGARFSPTLLIPIAPGARDAEDRLRKRVMPALTSVRFADGQPEPFRAFAARTKALIARECSGTGPTARLHAALRAFPMPLAWKRRAIAAERPSWMSPFSSVLGGRACISRIEIDRTSPPACAVSSPARLVSASDPLGSCVLTVVDDGTRAAVTLCGSGTLAAPALLEQALATLPR